MVWKNLTDKDQVASLLAKAGRKPRRGLGQNFLVCEEVVEATLLALTRQRPITELGAGIGTLTRALLEAGYKVRAIERDATLAGLVMSGLPRQLKKNLDLIINDLREVAWGWQSPYQLVGNIPYNLSGLVIRKLTQLTPAPERVVLLVQQEVGERLTARAGDLSLISVAVQMWGSAEKLLNVPASCFWPEPKVNSQLVLLSPKVNVASDSGEREAVLKLAKYFFQAKRKQIGGVMRRVFNMSAAEVENMLQQAGIEWTARPQEIPVKAWLALSRVVYSRKK